MEPAARRVAAGAVIRRARPADAPAMAALHLRAALAGYRHIFPPEAPPPTLEDLTSMWAGAVVGADTTALVADDGRALVGTALASTDADDARLGFLSRLYVEPEWWGRGLGSALHDAALARLRAAGHARAALWVLQENRRARAMYERRGWRLVEGVVKPTWGDIVDVRYERDLGAEEAAPPQ